MKNKVSGVGKDEPTVVNSFGGKQSQVLYRFDLLDPKAMFKMTEVLKEGAEKYGDNNWHNISVVDHLNHLIIHAYAYLAGDTSDDHLSHIMCRAMFAQGVDLMDQSVGRISSFKCGMCGTDISIDGYKSGGGLYFCKNCRTGHVISVDDTGNIFVDPSCTNVNITAHDNDSR